MWICSLEAQIPWPDSQPEAKEGKGEGKSVRGGEEMSELRDELRDLSVL